MEYRTLLKADLKKHKGSLSGVFILMLLVCAALGTVLTVWLNSERYIREELKRAGFGTLTAWVSNLPDEEGIKGLAADIENLDGVDRVDSQAVIYSDYTVRLSSSHIGSAEKHEQNSDSEGQLIPYNMKENRYKFFKDDLSGYREAGENETDGIQPGETYVSPSMVSMFGLQIGDEIRFPIARGGRTAVFTVKGFYEDPFMGSSMIGMKGFLINEDDYAGIVQTVHDSGIDALARSGAMLHVFQEEGSLPVSELNCMLNENTNLSEYTEFLHSESAIAGFMLILQNAFSGMLAAFVAVLLFAVMAVLGHSIGSAIEADYVNMGILKTVGFTGGKLRLIQMAQYLIFILGGMLAGVLISIPCSRFISGAILTSTGFGMPAGLPVFWCLLCCAAVFLALAGFILLKTAKINRITPMMAIRGEAFAAGSGKPGLKIKVPIRGTHVTLSLALRQLAAGSRSYAGACMVAVLLVFSASMVGRMDSWLGADGKGMMDAFNPADHDIGVQMFGEHTQEEAENTVRSHTSITDSYLLAMQGVSVNGIDYTANVISDPKRFHIMEGQTSMSESQVVLTEFVAADLGVSIGDTVTVQADMGEGEYVVSGIYSCANDMGDTIGMSREGYLRIGQNNPDIWCSHYFLEDPGQKGAVTEALKDAYGGDVHVHENTWPGLYGIIFAMQALLVFMYVMAAVFILIVTVMTGSRILRAEQRDIGIYKALGFTSGRLRTAFALRFMAAAVIGSLIGTMLAAVLTDPVVSAVMKLAGISNFSSSPAIGNTLVPPAAVILLFTGFAYAASWKVKTVDVTALIAE